MSYGAHGSGSSGGGGCGECQPPTMGMDDQGFLRVENGLTINFKSFNVDEFSQKLPVQTFETGKSNSIMLKIYDNTSPEYITHAEIHFGIHDEYIQGVIVEDSVVSIVWDDEGGQEDRSHEGAGAPISEISFVTEHGA